jgi:hypothetical protein
MSKWKDLREFIKTLPYIVVAIIVLVIVLFGYSMVKDLQGHMDKQDQAIQTINTTLVSIGDTLGKTDTQPVDPKELNKIIGEQLRDTLKDMGFDPRSSTRATGRVHRNVSIVKPTTKTKDSAVVELEWPENKQGITLKIGRATYYIHNDTFETETYPIDFKVDITTATDKSGKESTFASLVAEGDSTQYVIDIEEMAVHKVYPSENQWHVVPHIDGGVSVKINNVPQVGADIGVSPFAYGKTRDDNIFRAPRIGVGGNENSAWLEIQAEYNVGKKIPLFSDLWGAGGLCFDTQGQWAVCAGIYSTF